MEELCVYRSEDMFFHHSLTHQPDPERFTMHAHEMNEVLVFLSGKGSMLVEGNEYRLNDGSVLIMRAGETHKIRLSPDLPYERICIRFDDSVLHGIDPRGELIRPIRERRLGTENFFRLPSLKGVLPFVLDLNENTSEYHVRLRLLSFLVVILTDANNHFVREEHGFKEFKEMGKNYGIIEYINQNLHSDLSLDAIAQRFYLSKSQLSRSFKKATGSTLWDYVLIKRLLLARSLIRDGESIAGACEKSGFKEYSSFYRAYKKRFGISPNQDRYSPLEIRD